MNTPWIYRLIAAAGAAVTTWSLLLGVVSLGHPGTPGDTTQARQTPPQGQQPPAGLVARNERP